MSLHFCLDANSPKFAESQNSPSPSPLGFPVEFIPQLGRPEKYRSVENLPVKKFTCEFATVWFATSKAEKQKGPRRAGSGAQSVMSLFEFEDSERGERISHATQARQINI